MRTAFSDSPTRQSERAPRSIGMVSTFPPTSCGIATFAAALAGGLIADGASVDVVRCGESPDLEDPLVVASLGNWSAHRIAAAIDALNATDAVIVQHEYGIYDGLAGNAVIKIMAGVEVPITVVAHTVRSEPTEAQRVVLEEVCRMAAAVVVMTETARQRLIAGFDVDPAKLTVIPHGAATPPATPSDAVPDVWGDDGNHPDGVAGERAPRLLTWGLLGPGKGIEWAIDAMSDLADLHPRPQYLVAGATHPKVREHAGEAYREILVERAARSACAAAISFDDTYRNVASLTELIRSADLVVLPYDSAEQVTSGVLVDAVAAGRPVVATAFPHAVELLASGAGIVVPQREPQALAAAIRAVLTDPDRAAAMAAESRRLAPSLSWAAVAERYMGVLDRLVVGTSVRSS